MRNETIVVNEEAMNGYKVLDHGYLRLIESWGSDERIIEAARMSTSKGFLGWGPKVTGLPCYPNGELTGKPREELPGYLVDVWHSNGRPGTVDATNPFKDVREEAGDEKLLRYLWEHDHATPFEMAGLTIEVQAPIFVFREWHRHRVPFGYNELSARYTPMPDLNYVPTLERCMLGSDGKNKQAGTIKGAQVLTDEAAQAWLTDLENFYAVAEEFYQRGLNIGLPKELARVVVPVGRYSRMRATGNLRGWLGFLRLRMAMTAQWEIRQFADTVGKIVESKFPRTWELFAEKL